MKQAIITGAQFLCSGCYGHSIVMSHIGKNKAMALSNGISQTLTTFQDNSLNL